VDIVELIGQEIGLDAGRRNLSEQFTDAMSHYRVARWKEALESFDAILDEHPADGPARFYRGQCERLLAQGLTEEWSPTIRIDFK
jgi:hypothetical protein